jgi:hypothetical protein
LIDLNRLSVKLSHSFQNQKDTAFGETVRERISAYLKEQDIQPLATSGMVLKGI